MFFLGGWLSSRPTYNVLAGGPLKKKLKYAITLKQKHHFSFYKLEFKSNWKTIFEIDILVISRNLEDNNVGKLP